MTEGSSLSNPIYYAFTGDEPVEAGLTLIPLDKTVFIAPARGFYKNMQIYIRPVTVVDIYVNFFKYDGSILAENLPELYFIDGTEPIEFQDGKFTYNDPSHFDKFMISLKKGPCLYNHFDVTMIYMYQSGATESVTATDFGGI